MEVVDLPLAQLREAPWNPNVLDGPMMRRLKASLERYGLVENLVIRPLLDDSYEVLSGNQRLKLLWEMGHSHAPCLVVDLDDAQARLLAQALNHIRGEDDLGLRAELLRQVLEKLPQDDILDLLPETAESLQALASLGQEDLAAQLEAWQKAQAARLRHLQFQLTDKELAVVEEALSVACRKLRDRKGDHPNLRGRALTLICRAYLGRGGIV